MTNRLWFKRYAWFVVAYTVLVILWGAVVRATGSGAGCGNHWPTCDGQVIPQAEDVQTVIEFSHRLTSGLSGVFVLILLAWTWRLKPVSKFLRWMAVLSFIFILIEGGLGAALVRLELVEDNASTLRAIMVAIHLSNTLVLLAFMTLTAWSSTRENIRYQAYGKIAIGFGIALIGFLVMSAAGAVTALGDTLFLSGALERGLEANASPYDHFLVQLRVYHPMIAVTVSAYLFAFGYYLFQKHSSEAVHDATQRLLMLVGLQLGLGVLNIVLKAPLWMQLSHLLLADLLWILLIVLAANALSQSKPLENNESSVLSSQSSV